MNGENWGDNSLRIRKTHYEKPHPPQEDHGRGPPGIPSKVAAQAKRDPQGKGEEKESTEALEAPRTDLKGWEGGDEMLMTERNGASQFYEFEFCAKFVTLHLP